ncbi:MAG TPA: radical SAM protein [Candidatus Nanoarchaeia archaeon]|nr:radical SAM protein [Candidatus Nanoarchaeia archaeon]
MVPTSVIKPQKKGRILLMTPNLKGLSDPNSVHRIQPPLGPMIAASIIRQQGHEVKIHDCALADFYNRVPIDEKSVLIGQDDRDIQKVIEDYQPDILGISALFSNLVDSAHNLARIAKDVVPKCSVIMGGNHIGNAVKDYLYAKMHPGSGLSNRLVDFEDPFIDLVMHGEVDFEFPKLVNSILNKGDFSKISGLVMRKEGPLEYLINPTPAAITPLSSLPLPARDLVDMEGYFSIGAFHSAKSKSKRVVNIMASRGCPEKCTFCTTPDTWGAKVRWRNIDDVILEIKDAQANYNVGEIQFEDDTITANKPMLMMLCKELEKVGLPWCTPNGTKTNYHVSTQGEMYKAMADSGCYQITLACESGVQRVLDKIIQKNLKVEQMKPAIEKAKQAGMLVHTFWILGYPGETYDEMQETIKVAEDCGADSYSFAILNPLPGTPIYRKVVREELWWPGKSLNDLMYRNSLIKVDGFSSSEEFENFVTETNIRLNSLLQKRDLQRYEQKYGPDASPRMLVKQT